MRITAFFLAPLLVLSACGPDAETEKARAAHEHRLAWQKAHPKEYALQQAQLGAEAAKRAAYAAEHTPCKNFGRGIDASLTSPASSPPIHAKASAAARSSI
jgi:hypothetical protein